MGSVLANHICLTGLQIHRSKINGIHDIEFIFTKISNREQLLSVLLPRYSHVNNEFYPKETFEKVILMPADTLPRNRILIPLRDSLGQLYSKVSITEETEICATLSVKLSAMDCDRWFEIPKSERRLFRLESSVDYFLEAYCIMSPSLPMHNCANAVLRTVNLSRFDDMESILQLRTAFKGIAETEKELLGMLDEQMKGCERNRRHPNSVMLGLCLRRLSLKFRRTLSQCRRHKLASTADMAKRMYDGCISAYSRVYWKSESPYSASWRLEDHSKDFGDDPGLIEMFGRIMRTERNYCEALDENDEDEKVLRELFLHSKQRGEKSWSG